MSSVVIGALKVKRGSFGSLVDKWQNYFFRNTVLKIKRGKRDNLVIIFHITPLKRMM